MIRKALASDIPRIVEMTIRFHQESAYSQHIGFNPQQIAALTTKVVFDGICLVSEHEGEVFGVIGLLILPHFVSGEMVANEVAWWVEPEHRGDGVRLVREAEKLARAAGAKRIQMIAPTEQVGLVYQRLGYGYVETAWDKQL